MAVDLGKTTEPHEAHDDTNDLIATELLLKRVAGEVSNMGDSGGLLRQLKEFNTFLERTALALEARKA